jgi:mono/diheme cytochrome c family protein
MKAIMSAGLVALLAAFSAQAQSRGELLYSTHCIGCHTTKMHWRDNRAATDWAGIVVQVGKWQSANSLSWNQQDVVAVARYLNDSFYHFEPTAPATAASTGAARP